MIKYYVTFPFASPLKKAYMIVEAENPKEVIAKLTETYGRVIWSCFYTEEAFHTKMDRYGLYEIPYGYMPEK